LITAGGCAAQLVQQAWDAIDNFFAAWTPSFGDSAHRKRWKELETFRDWVRATQTSVYQDAGADGEDPERYANAAITTCTAQRYLQGDVVYPPGYIYAF
jgi:hypothetical protein